jgi:hypothetical protein
MSHSSTDRLSKNIQFFSNLEEAAAEKEVGCILGIKIINSCG